MRSEQVRVQTDADDPFSGESRVLPGREATVRPAAAGEQIVAPLLAGSLHVVVDRLPCCLSQFELDWTARLPLPNGSPVNCVAARCNIIDLECDDVATAKLAVDGEIEQSKVADTTFDLQLCADAPNMLGTEWRLRSLPLFQGIRSEVAATILEASVMVTLLS